MSAAGKGPGVGLDFFSEPLKGSKVGNWGIGYLCDTLLKNGEIDLDPDYQRDHVWNLDQQQAFMGHVLEGGSMPDLWMRWIVTHERTEPPYYECVDGKQRITAMLDWWSGEIAAVLSPENGGREIWACDLSSRELLKVKLDLCVPRVQFLEGYTRAQVLRVYLRLNGGGTPHQQHELERVRALLRSEA